MNGALARLFRNDSGSISVLTALVLPVFIGMLGLGAEVSYWMLHNRSLQNAADSAAIAASIAGASGYAAEANAITRQYGLVDRASGVAVTVSNTAACPGGGATCYSVTIADTVPSYLGALVNYLGTAALRARASRQGRSRRRGGLPTNIASSHCPAPPAPTRSVQMARPRPI